MLLGLSWGGQRAKKRKAKKEYTARNYGGDELNGRRSLIPTHPASAFSGFIHCDTLSDRQPVMSIAFICIGSGLECFMGY